MIEIRAASPGDAVALAELRWEFRAPRAEQTETHEAFATRCGAWMRGELASDRWRAWVAADGDRIVGQIWLYLLPKIPNPTAEPEHNAYISNLYVTPGARGGIGSRLLNAAIESAKSAHVDYVVLWPTERSRSLYMREGFTAGAAALTLKCS
jgi:GNAT superfamily N-acetyltransferase